MKIAELTGTALDWAVAKCELGEPVGSFLDGVVPHPDYIKFYPSTDWAQGGPIIEREKIEIRRGNDLYFPQGNENGDHYEKLWIAGKHTGQTPLIAAMRCYVASKLGEEVDVPTELTGGK